MDYKPSHRGVADSSSVLKLNDLMDRYERNLECLKELQIIRKAMLDGTYDNSLHRVVNASEALTTMIGCSLPPPSNGYDNKELLDVYVKHIDVAIEGLKESIVNIIETLYKAFCEWLKDQFLVLNRYRIKLQKYRAEYVVNKSVIGNKDTFDKIELFTYAYNDWDTLVKAAKNLSVILSKIKADDVNGWVNSNLQKINEYLGEFGASIEGGSFKRGSVKYERTNKRLSDLRWRSDNFQVYFDMAIDLLKEAIEDQNTEKIVKTAYAAARKEAAESGDNKAKDELKMVLDLFRFHRNNVAGVARVLAVIYETAKNNKGEKK